ncbi:uncharacterized protein JN550_000340 [Neoarthrinium moseri]|uniref:uncharacterized protein n=1 Tax=Neoarthrinium moseri TaxID=1658444 RepID=UPI001FDC329B|nr:uncharacterized protein JN550_000340 [Neoarthrinium moseri]KAI1878158.1 hypothetical protein JN550_000340 [Neoarthrinium moseri]
MADLKYDTEFWGVIGHLIAGAKSPDFDDHIALRMHMEEVSRQLFQHVPRPAGVSETKYDIVSLDGTNIALHRFAPDSLKNATSPQRAVIYLHAGGMIMGSIDMFKPQIENDAVLNEVQFFGVEYRLAPEHPAPAALEDTYAAIQWIQANAKELNVDPARIALMGHSAGGGIAAGTALMARDKGLSPPLARLVLIYPMLDDRTTLESGNVLGKYLTWTSQNNDIGWKAYLGGRERGNRADVSIYAAPGRAENLEGLPPTYLEIGGLDLFKAENIAFAGKLATANNGVEFHLYAGLVHGWDGIAPTIRAFKQAAENRKRVLADF